MDTAEIWYLKKKTKLDARLIEVASRIRANVHVDIGSDHGNLLLSLLKNEQINYGIAIENNQQPYQNSFNALQVFFPPRPIDGTAPGVAEVRLGDGLAALQPGEADSLSICGLGGRAIARILNAHPNRVPDQVVVQPNNRPEEVRQWGVDNDFQLLDETIVGEEREFLVIAFRRKRRAGPLGEDKMDPAYKDVDLEAAILFGPLIIKREPQHLLKQLDEEMEYWNQFSRLTTPAARRLEIVKRLRNTLPRESQ